MQSGFQGQLEARNDLGHQVVFEAALGTGQKSGDVAEAMQDLPVGIDQKTAGGVTAEQAIIIVQQLAIESHRRPGRHRDRTDRGDCGRRDVEAPGQGDRAGLAKDFGTAVEGFEMPGKPAQAFAAAQKQGAVGTQGKMEGRQQAVLDLGLQVDQQVATADQVDAGKGRIAEQVVGRENDQFPQLGTDPEIVLAVFPEKLLPPEG